MVLLRFSVSKLAQNVRQINNVRMAPNQTLLNFSYPHVVRCSISPLYTGSVRLNKKDKSLELVQDNFATRFYKTIFSGLPKSKLKASGYILLTHCAQNTNLIQFFKTFNMPDTFYSWFLVTELHVWLLGARVMIDGDSGRLVRNSIVEALWQDCDNRAKSIGTPLAASVRNKKIGAIAEEFQAALFVYDEGLLGDDIQLANALWRRFFLSMNEDEEGQLADPEKLEILVNYVRRVANYLDQMDSVDLIVSNKINWPPLIQE